MSGYFAFIYPPDDGSSWGVTFPDLPGCASSGSSLEDAAVNAREALSGHLAALRADGDLIPPPRLWVEIGSDPETMADAAGAFIHYVVPRQISGERVRINITIDKGLLRVADEVAEARGLSRSAFIESALTIAAGT